MKERWKEPIDAAWSNNKTNKICHLSRKDYKYYTPEFTEESSSGNGKHPRNIFSIVFNSSKLYRSASNKAICFNPGNIPVIGICRSKAKKY